MMNAVGVIPARYGSTRLPGKSLVLLCGKPLIVHVVENASKARRLDALWVATDDVRIAEAVKGTGARVAMTRADHPSGTDRIAEAVRGQDCRIVVNIQGDEPLIDPLLIDRLVQELEDDKEAEMATAVAPLHSPEDLKKTSVVKVVCDGKKRALYFSRLAIPFARDGNFSWADGIYRRHIGIYAYRKAFLERFVAAPPCDLEQAEKLEQLRALYLGVRIRVVEAASCHSGVDTPEDVKLVENELRKRKG
jgi:3-deoxy-manno-octulosonate cytidylyltransferase (CMP-KDO synthetase)